MREAPEPTDFARDYVTAHARVHRDQRVPPAGEDGNAYAASIGVPEVVLLGGPYYLHPLPALLVVLPLVPLGYKGASLAWLASSLLALAVMASGLVTIVTRGRTRRWTWGALAFVALLLWPPVLHNLAKGQWSIFLATLLTLGWVALERRRPTIAGAYLGSAVSLKATPVLLLGYLAVRQRRAAVAFVAVVACSLAAALIVSGVDAWRPWIAAVPHDVAIWQTWVGNTASLNGFIARLFVGGAFARPLVQAPLLARGLQLGATLALVSWVAAATWRTPPSPAGNRAVGAAWLALVVLLNPLAWTHSLVIAVPAMILLYGLAPTSTLVVALALMSVPRQTLAALAGPTPVPPATAPLLSLHAFALLLLVAAGVRAARGATTTASPELAA